MNFEYGHSERSVSNDVVFDGFSTAVSAGLLYPF